MLKEYKGQAGLIAGGTDLLSALKDEILTSCPTVI